MRLLVTGANGVTGHAVIRHLVARGVKVAGLVSGEASEASIAALGAEPVIADLRDNNALREAMSGVDRVYHICPAGAPDEVEIGACAIAAAQASDIALFGYHSVIAPHLEEMPSHWAKMKVQMALMRSNLPFSVVQPAAYMQNFAGPLAAVSKTGVLELPFRADAPLSWVDVEDVGKAVAILMTRPAQSGGTYELCGTDTPMTSHDIAEVLAGVIRRKIEARACALTDFIELSPYRDYSDTQKDHFKSYIQFVDQFGMRAGNPRVLTDILGHQPTGFTGFIERLL